MNSQKKVRLLLLLLMTAAVVTQAGIHIFEPWTFTKEHEWLGPSLTVYTLNPLVWYLTAGFWTAGILWLVWGPMRERRWEWAAAAALSAAEIALTTAGFLREAPAFMG